MTAGYTPYEYKDCPIKEILERQIEALSEKTELNFRLTAEAFTKNERIMDERLDRMNEFRESLKDQASEFSTRSESMIRHKELQRQVDELRLARATLEGKASITSVYVSYFLIVINIVVSCIAIIITVK